MKLCIHRGTHQIGGIAAEISTATTRILIDMGDELSLDPNFVSAPLNIPGVTDTDGCCDAVLFTHYHGDHTGQMLRIRPEIPLYAGALAKEIMLISARHGGPKNDALCQRMEGIQAFSPGKTLLIGDIQITPFCIDHSACDSYLFLIEADGKRVLYTGDFRLHGVRGGTMDKILDRRIGKVDAVITEGTTVSRSDGAVVTEWDLQKRVKTYLRQYKYVFVLCATTNLDRIFALARAVPYGKYCICDNYQKTLVQTVSEHWAGISTFYQMPKLTVYGDNLLPRFQTLGGLMFIRANRQFEGFLTAKAITDIYYLTHRQTHSDKATRDVLTKLCALFGLLDTTALDIRKAISAEISDFEDAVMVETAVRSGVPSWSRAAREA